jgi:hypothetical protein
MNKPCPQCGYQGNVNASAGLRSLLEDIPPSIPIRARGALGSPPPSFTAEETEGAWAELTRLEMLLEKVDLWRAAGYFKREMEALDPVSMQRAYAEELRQRLDGVPRPGSPRTDQDQLKTLGFLMDKADLIASRGWFKSKKAIEKAVVPILAMMLDVIAGNATE